MDNPVAFDPQAWREMPPEFTNGNTVHIPMSDAALEYLEADASVRVAVAAEELARAEAIGVVDPPFYRWAIDAYREPAALLLNGDAMSRCDAWVAIEALGPGLAGAAFHGVIRSACALVRRDPDELARGLAYMRATRQVLAGPGRAVATDTSVPMLDATTLGRHSIFAQLDLLAGIPGAFSEAVIEGEIPPVLVMVADALSILHRAPGDFLNVHAVTSLHALIEFAAVVSPADLRGTPGDGPMQRWWRAWMIGAHLVGLAVDINDPAAIEPAVADDVATAVAAAIAGRDSHDIKLAMSLRRMVALDVCSEPDAAVALSARVNATRQSG